MLAIFLLLSACETPEKQSVNQSPSPSHVQKDIPKEDPLLKDDQSKKIIRQLSAYDGNGDCENLPKENLQERLTHIVDHVARPPWAPMRAASCLAKMYPEAAETDLIRWVENPKTKGLAFLLAGQIKELPKAVAFRVAQAGLDGPHAKDFRVRLIKVQDPRLQELLPPTP